MANLADTVATDIKNKLDAIAGTPFRDAVFLVQSQGEFEHKAKLMKTPYVGVMYSGVQADHAADASKKGMFGRAVISIIYGVQSIKTPSDQLSDAWDLMAKGRRAIRLTKSPTGHDWRFQQEKYFDTADNGVAYFTQTWDTGAPLTGENA